jgi:hypothetical protein
MDGSRQVRERRVGAYTVPMKRFALLALVLIGCSSSGGDGTIGTGHKTAAEAQADCNSFEGLYCRTFSACPDTVDQSTCMSQVAADIACTSVVGEMSTLAGCESDITATSCAQLTAGNLPSSCLSVFLLN